jgi:hypothetical protein
MASGTVYRKTALGAAEVKERSLKINPRLRTMLILVDGTLDEATLRQSAAQVGAPEDFLARLLELGLIEPLGSLKDMLG